MLLRMFEKELRHCIQTLLRMCEKELRYQQRLNTESIVSQYVGGAKLLYENQKKFISLTVLISLPGP